MLRYNTHYSAYLEQVLERRMMHGLEHVRQGKVRQEFGLGTELGAPVDQKGPERVHRRTVLVVIARFRLNGTSLALRHCVVHVQIERELSVLVRPLNLFRQISPCLLRLCRL